MGIFKPNFSDGTTKVNFGSFDGIVTPQSDWAQTNKKAADYIKNKPDLEGILERLEDAHEDFEQAIEQIQEFDEKQQREIDRALGRPTQGLEYTYNGWHYTCVGRGTISSDVVDIIIPSEINGKRVITIDWPNDSITKSIYIPYTVGTIHGFIDCPALEKINIPNSVRTAGNDPLSGNIFGNSPKLTIYTEHHEIPENWREYYGWNFPNERVIFGYQPNVKSINEELDEKVAKNKIFSSVNNPEGSPGLYYSGVRCIDYSDSGIGSVDVFIKEGTEVLAWNAFVYHDSEHRAFKNLILPDSMTTIESRAIQIYAYYWNEAAIYIPKSITTIQEEAIYDDWMGEQDYLLTIYCEADGKPDGWADNWIQEGKNVKVVWGYAFNNKKLNEKIGDKLVVLEPEQPDTPQDNGYTTGLEYILSDDMTYYVLTSNLAYLGFKEGDVVRIPPEYLGLPVKKISSCIYNDFSNFDNESCSIDIYIPDSVTTIEESAFTGINGNIYIPNSVVNVEDYLQWCAYPYGYGKVNTYYCEATSKPSDWGEYWHWRWEGPPENAPYDPCDVVWGATWQKEPEAPAPENEYVKYDTLQKISDRLNEESNKYLPKMSTLEDSAADDVLGKEFQFNRFYQERSWKDLDGDGKLEPRSGSARICATENPLPPPRPEQYISNRQLYQDYRNSFPDRIAADYGTNLTLGSIPQRTVDGDIRIPARTFENASRAAGGKENDYAASIYGVRHEIKNQLDEFAKNIPSSGVEKITADGQNLAYIERANKAGTCGVEAKYGLKYETPKNVTVYNFDNDTYTEKEEVLNTFQFSSGVYLKSNGTGRNSGQLAAVLTDEEHGAYIHIESGTRNSVNGSSERAHAIVIPKATTLVDNPNVSILEFDMIANGSKSYEIQLAFTANNYLNIGKELNGIQISDGVHWSRVRLEAYLNEYVVQVYVNDVYKGTLTKGTTDFTANDFAKCDTVVFNGYNGLGTIDFDLDNVSVYRTIKEFKANPAEDVTQYELPLRDRATGVINGETPSEADDKALANVGYVKFAIEQAFKNIKRAEGGSY